MASGETAAAELTERDVDGVHIVRVTGELDLAAAAGFCARVDAARAAGHRRLVIDLSRLEFCDTSGLRALIRAVGEFRVGAAHAVVVPPADGAGARMFELAGASEILPLCPSAGDGLTALAPTR